MVGDHAAAQAGTAAHTRAELLRRTPLFSVMPAGDIEELAQWTAARRFHRGDYIYRQGDPGETLYVIVNGAVKLSVASPDGQESVLTILTAGQFFGEHALFHEQRRTVNAEALELTQVITVGREDLLRVLERRPRQAISQLLIVVGERLQETDEKLHDSGYLDIPARLAKRLLDLAGHHGRQMPEGLRIELPLTQTDLAGMIGARRENVNRALTSFKTAGIVIKSRGHFVILDHEKLRARASGTISV